MCPVDVFLQYDAVLRFKLNRIANRVSGRIEFQHIFTGYPRLVNHDGIVQVAPLLHVGVQLRFAHESRPAGNTFVRLFVAVHEPMSISVVSTVERFAAHFAGEWLRPGMNLLMLLKVLRIHKSRRTDVAFVRTFACVTRFYVIVQQTAPLEAPTADIALVSFVVEMCGPFMRL